MERGKIEVTFNKDFDPDGRRPAPVVTTVVTVEYDGNAQDYASIQMTDRPRYWIERDGADWELHTGSVFGPPVKKWRTKNRGTLERVIPDALAFILDQ